MTLALIAFVISLKINTLVSPTVYSDDDKVGVPKATVSHTLSVLIIHLIYLFFNLYIMWVHNKICTRLKTASTL